MAEVSPVVEQDRGKTDQPAVLDWKQIAQQSILNKELEPRMVWTQRPCGICCQVRGLMFNRFCVHKQEVVTWCRFCDQERLPPFDPKNEQMVYAFSVSNRDKLTRGVPPLRLPKCIEYSKEGIVQVSFEDVDTMRGCLVITTEIFDTAGDLVGT